MASTSIVTSIVMRRCTKCMVEKTEAEFSFVKKRQQYSSLCKMCHNTATIEWRKNASPLPIEPIVYRITNVANGKTYIGVTHRPFRLRKAEHIRLGNNGSRFPIHAAIRKYGVWNFTFEVIERLQDIAALPDAERRHIQENNCIVPFGYNRTEGGSGMCGLKHSEETIIAQIASHTGYRHTLKARAKISAAQIGKKMPREAVEAARQKRLGIKRTEEQRARIAAGCRSGKKPSRTRNTKNCKYSAEILLNAISRVRAGEKQNAVAREIGMHQSYLSQLLSGKSGATLRGGLNE